MVGFPIGNGSRPVDRSITGEDAIDTLAELFAMRGVPKCVRWDNGPEFTAQAIRRGLDQVDVDALYIEAEVRGRTVTPGASTAGSTMSSWRWNCSRVCRQRD
jgi:transposase InsO family protein